MCGRNIKIGTKRKCVPPFGDSMFILVSPQREFTDSKTQKFMMHLLKPSNGFEGGSNTTRFQVSYKIRKFGSS